MYLLCRVFTAPEVILYHWQFKTKKEMSRNICQRLVSMQLVRVLFCNVKKDIQVPGLNQKWLELRSSSIQMFVPISKLLTLCHLSLKHFEDFNISLVWKSKGERKKQILSLCYYYLSQHIFFATQLLPLGEAKSLFQQFKVHR